MIKIKKFPFAPKGDKRLRRWGYSNDAQKMNKYIKNGDVVYDCGANIFDHSIFFALNNPKSKVIAFEPIKEYFEMGLKNAKYFGTKNIFSLPIALGEKASSMSISVANEGSSLVCKEADSKFEQVKVETIDELVSKKTIAPPNFIKIDVEGFALPLLKGAQKTILKYKPTIIIELHPQFVGLLEAESKIKFLEEMGYSVIDVLDMGREFVMTIGGTEKNWKMPLELIFEKMDVNKRVWAFRNEYENASSKSCRNSIKTEYKIFRKEHKIHFIDRLLWSQLYVLFRFKKKCQ